MYSQLRNNIVLQFLPGLLLLPSLTVASLSLIKHFSHSSLSLAILDTIVVYMISLAQYNFKFFDPNNVYICK
jgi:cation transporter-like permease